MPVGAVLGGEAFGGAAGVVVLAGVPGSGDALVADGEQDGGEQHEGCQASEAAPAAGNGAGHGLSAIHVPAADGAFAILGAVHGLG
jgi:hypothetical protein